MDLFLSDLDNTLIYSYKRDIGEDKILVEQKDGKALSYMTRRSVELLHTLQTRATLIPLTTRSVLQYKRIEFPQFIVPSLALAANGGILLVDGEIDSNWYGESQGLIKDAKEQMEEGISLLQKDSNVYYDIGYVDGLFVFTKSKEPARTMETLSQRLDLSRVSIHENGEKVYILPKALHKGVAIQRMKKRFLNQQVLSAGDSLFDIPMLLSADIGFYPKALQKYIDSGEYQEFDSRAKLISIDTPVFSDGLLERLLEGGCR